jgi:hypothetical protein
MNYLKIAGVVVVLAFIAYIGVKYPEAPQPVAGSPVGSTFSTAKIAAVDITPSTVAATSSSLLNTDTSDRYIKSIEIGCEGVGATLGITLAQWKLEASTSTVPGVSYNANSNLAENVNLSTTSPLYYTASSTVSSGTGTGGAGLFIWPAGTYLNVGFNATNTAACVVSTSYLAS